MQSYFSYSININCPIPIWHLCICAIDIQTHNTCIHPSLLLKMLPQSKGTSQSILSIAQCCWVFSSYFWKYFWKKTTGAESWRGESVHRRDTHDRQEQTPQDTGNDCCDTDLRKMNRLSVLKHKHLSPYLTITVFNYYDNILRSCLEGST